MSNNGHLINSVCLPSIDFSISSCRSLYPSESITGTAITYYPSLFVSKSTCRTSTTWVNGLSNFPNYDCTIENSSNSTIPTVADGIALGWQAGAALILVGCILFMKKALK